MRLKITVSCMWHVAEEDVEMAKELAKENPTEALLDYLQDALRGDTDLTDLESSVELVD